MSVIKIDVKKNVPQMDKQTEEALTSSVKEITDRALASLQARTPIKTGRLRSAYHKIVLGLTGQILNPTSYFWMVEKGTRPHSIVAKDARALHFSIDGQEVFAKSVQHPGTRGAFMIRDTVEEIRSVAPEVVKKHLQRMVKI